MREKLPSRRLSITSTVKYMDIFAQGRAMEIDVTFGFIPQETNYRLCECFISSKTHPLSPLLNDICILLSKLMQYGDSIESIASGLGENRKEMEMAGPPSSFIGAIARQGMVVQNDLNIEFKSLT